ncbi:hypothetical protein ACLB2K_052079 [Fragaria x ananassa]
MTTMRLQPSSPELIPTSSPPGLTPEKRPNPTSSPSDLVLASSPTDPNQAKEAKPDNTDPDYSDEHLARLYSTPEDRNLPPDEIWSKSMDDFVQALMEKVPKPCTGLKKKLPETLPKGCTWVLTSLGVELEAMLLRCFASIVARFTWRRTAR